MDCTDTSIIIKDLKEFLEIFDKLMLYIYTSIWVPCTPNAGPNLLLMFLNVFARFRCKNEEKCCKEHLKTYFCQFSRVLEQRS